MNDEALKYEKRVLKSLLQLGMWWSGISRGTFRKHLFIRFDLAVEQ